jgi:hypothetical protein
MRNARSQFRDGVATDGALPPGTIELVSRLLKRLGSDLDPTEVVMLPHLLGSAEWATPPPPLPVGDGAVHRDLGPDDEETWLRFLDTLDAAARDPEALAVHAQEWRLPVTPYRRRAEGPLGPLPAAKLGTLGPQGDRIVPNFVEGSVAGVDLPLADADGIHVVDLTSTWAGPLATRVLADAGAHIVRIEPDCRRDNLRDGSPAMFDWLGSGKRTEALDLRDPAGRAELEHLIAGADVVIDSFSPRVMPNFGLTPEHLDSLRPGIVSVGLPAFPSDVAERDWVAYGTGIHAISGLGDDGAGGFWSPIVPYPDPIAGLSAAVTVLGMLAGGGPRHARVSLLDSIRPLL